MKSLVPALFVAVLALAACKDAAPPSSGAASPSAPAAQSGVSIDTIAAQAQGFAVGPSISARTVYVFFDAQCPHCAALWQAAKPLKGQARFVWIPVGLLNPSSTSQGAALLAAPDPAAAMDAHEASFGAGQGGISAMGDLDKQKAAIAANTKLFDSFGFTSVPTIVAKHAQSGALVTQAGALATPALAQALGLQLP